MATTATKTVRDMVTRALRLARVTAVDEDPTAADADQAMDMLNSMIKGWQNEGHSLWYRSSMTLAMDGDPATSYTLPPARPLEIHSARWKGTATGSEIPMLPLTRDEYDELPNKSTTGTPTQYHYDRQRENARFYIWPILSAASATASILITYTREAEDITSLSDVLEMPGEWWETTAYALASRLNDIYGQAVPSVIQRAEILEDKAFAFDREGSVFFGIGS